MSAAARDLAYHRLRAPRASGSALIEPPPDEVDSLLAANAQRRLSYRYDFQGRSLSELAAQGRAELLREAQRYTSAYRDVEAVQNPEHILLAGHQPVLFHPGVWFKNFVLGALSQQHHAAAVNLVIDSDTIKHATLRVLGGTVAEPSWQEIEFDRATPEIPFEERAIVDRDLLATFSHRAAAQLAPLVPNPLLRKFWPLVLERSRHTGNLGACLAQARHQLEAGFDLATLELPQSRICRLEAFDWFAAHLLTELPRFHGIYNAAVADYRHVHRVRSANHPVPDLATEDEWLEAPLWVWRADEPRRRRLFVRRRGDELLLTDRGSWEAALPCTEGDGSRTAEALAALANQSVKLRTRALITTLFARLILGDLFLHGIGGAKYDQLTNLLIRRFFGLEPPEFLTVSATLQLPIERAKATEGELHDVNRRLRELTWNPQRLLSPSAEPQQNGDGLTTWLAAKQEWITAHPTPENARERHLRIRESNEALQPYVAGERERLHQTREELVRRVRAEAILSWREYAFCLYPEPTLRDFLRSLVPTR